MKRIGVLYLMPWLIVGGAENQVVQLLRFIDRKRFRPVVCCIREKGQLFSEVEELGIPSYCLDTRPKYGASVLTALDRIRQIIRREDIQVLQAMEFNARVLGAAAARLSGVQVNIAAEHYTGEWQEPAHKRIVKRLTVPFVDRIICVAEAQKQYLIDDRGFPSRKMEVIYNGIDVDKFDPGAAVSLKRSDFSIPEDSPVVGIVAALRPEKAHHIFLKAAERISKEVPNAHFLIVGDGKRRAKLEALSRDLGIAERTVFAGVRKDVPEVLSLMDVVALSSYPVVETFPVSLLEAMAMKKPVVSTNVSGVPEMIEEGINGRLVPVGDHEKLGMAISGLLKDKKLAREMGEKGRRLVEEKFTIQQTVKNYEDLYTRLLESEQTGRQDRAAHTKDTPGGFAGRTVILHLTHGKTYSGGEHSLYLLYKYIDREKYEPVIVCLEDGLLRKRLSDLGHKVYCLDSGVPMPLHLFPKIWSIAKNENASLVINQTTRTTLIGRLLSLFTGRPNITIIQAPILRDTNTTSPRRVNHLIERLTGFLSDRHIVVNRAIRDDMIGGGKKPHKISTIYNSVDPEYLDYRPGNTRFRGDFGISADRPAAGMIASFRPRKGAEYLIRAMPAVLERVPDAVLFMIGHGEWVSGKDYIDELKELVRSEGVGDSVVFTGFRSDIPQVVSELDCMVLPSIYGEGSSLTLLEAMGLACPCIASATEGNVELIKDGVTGLLVPPADAGGLSKAIVTVLEDRKKAREMGEAAKQKVKREFLADRMAKSYAEVIEELFE